MEARVETYECACCGITQHYDNDGCYELESFATDVCIECYLARVSECPQCGNDFENREFTIGDVFHALDEDAGVPIGVYVVTSVPFYSGSVLGSWLYEESVTKIADCERDDNDAFPIMFCCNSCATKATVPAVWWEK